MNKDRTIRHASAGRKPSSNAYEAMIAPMTEAERKQPPAPPPPQPPRRRPHCRRQYGQQPRSRCGQGASPIFKKMAGDDASRMKLQGGLPGWVGLPGMGVGFPWSAGHGWWHAWHGGLPGQQGLLSGPGRGGIFPQAPTRPAKPAQEAAKGFGSL